MRSTYNMLPFRRIPKLMLEHIIQNAVFWLNAFPALDGVSDTLSPKYIVTGRNVNMKLHVRTKFGAYVQTHEEHSNDMRARTLGAICLGPTGAAQGSHYFMSVATGKRITRQHWTPLPMPTDVIEAVSNRGLQQGMPTTLTFADRHGMELIDDDDDVDDDHDSLYSSSNASATHTHTDDDDISYDSDASDVTMPPPQTPVDDDASAYDNTNSVDDADETDSTHSDDPDNDQPPDNAGTQE
ncbi:unnamed protein product [Cylindrotheca closterium]|uniref:Uncharacterized protein n=1 Tax=Cylindrotheca closterium TaxID=2856 RepID=A0AAD2CVT3_9STRA|nr:unnamed protein product [Cylindrotheca closterium]